MKYRFHILFSFLIAFALLGVQRAAAQDNQDNNPHIQPKASPTPTPTPKARSAQQQSDQYDRPPFPGDAPGTQPAEPAAKSPDGYERPAFPGDAPGANPTTGNTAGESSSRDSLIDLNSRPKDEPAPAPDDEAEFKPWDPHKAAKDVEVG